MAKPPKHQQAASYSYFDDENKIGRNEAVILTDVKKRHFKKGEFYMQAKVFDSLLSEMIKSGDFTMLDMRTLIAMKQRIDYNNRIKNFTQKEIAEEISSSQANVSRSIQLLLKHRIIIKDGLDMYFNANYIKYAGDDQRKSKSG